MDADGNVRTDLLERSRPELVALLRDEIRALGRITFARFMEVALYHPELGYYMGATSPAGFSGDFLTGPETHRIFGQALARQVAECWDRLGQPSPFVVREMGAGSGALARDILEGLRNERPDVLEAVRYEVDDVNRARVETALEWLTQAGLGSHVAALSAEPHAGVLLANELLDALPVHRLALVEARLRELYVGWHDGWFADIVGELSDPVLAEPLDGLPLAKGQRLEVAPLAWEWVATIPRSLARGYAILIDYGYPAAKLYDPVARHEGTLRGYSRHLVTADPYDRVGLQDLTAHVDFTAVSRAATTCGMVELGLTSQAYFFAGLGIEELLLRLQETATEPTDYLNARETVMHLLEPHGLGRFSVLVLGQGVPAKQPLRGLSFVLR